MAKRSGRHLSKKLLPKAMKRITEIVDGKRKRLWALGEMRFFSLKEFFMTVRAAQVKEAEEKFNAEKAKKAEALESSASGLAQVV